jgi:hypothetical protein
LRKDRVELKIYLFATHDDEVVAAEDSKIVSLENKE